MIDGSRLRPAWQRLAAVDSRLWAATLLVALALALLYPALLGGKVMSGSDLLQFQPPLAAERPAGLTRPSNQLLYDAAYVFQPDQQFDRRTIRDGRLPDWSPYISAGRPLLAAQQSAPFYPANWLMYLLPYWKSLAVIALLKLLAAGLGMVLFCRALGLRDPPALLAGVVFAFCTYLVTWLEHPHSNSYVLLPWLMLLAERLARRGRPAHAIGLGALLGAALLGGHPQSVFIVMLAVVPWFAWRVPAGARLRRSVLFGGAAVLGVAIAAVALLPFGELVRHSYDVSRGEPPVAPRSIYGFFFPELWGRPDRFQVPGEPIFYPERVAYFGVLPLLLAVGGLAARRIRGEQVFFAGLGVFALLVALDSGPFADVVRKLPVFSDANLNRILILAAFAGAVLAAYGLQAALEGSRRERLRLLAGMAVTAAIPLLWLLAHAHVLSHLGQALGELPRIGHTPRSTEVVELASVLRWALLALVSLALVTLLVRRPRLATWVAVAAVAIAAADLVDLNRGYNPAVSEARAAPAPAAAVRYLQRLHDGRRVAAEGEALGPNTASRYGLEDARGHELPVVERYQRLWTALGGQGFQRTLVPGVPGIRRLLDVFGVGHVISPALAAAHDPRFPVEFGRPGEQVVRNAGALPRAWVAYAWRPSAGLGPSLRAVARSSERSLRDAPVIEGARPPPSQGSPATPVRVTSTDDDHVTVEVDARAPAQLVLLDTFYPGWKAKVDGRAATIRPANAAFRAVALPAGRHRVHFSYVPLSVRAGAAISVASVVLAAVALAVMAVRRRRLT